MTDYPEFNSITGDAADFSAQYKVTKNHIELNETLRMKKRIYDAEDWQNFCKAVKAVKNVTETPIVLIKK